MRTSSLSIDVIAILRRIGARVAAARGRSHSADVAIHLAEQNAATFVRIGLFSVPADFGVVVLADLQHAKGLYHRVTEKHEKSLDRNF